MQELSREELIRLYGSNMGNQFVFGRTNLSTPRTICGITPFGRIIDSGRYDFDIERCLLVLKPLAQLTRENINDILRIINEPIPTADITPEKMAEFATWAQEHIDAMTVPVADYLREQGFDCGYKHIPSLIKANLAITPEQANNT